MSDEPTLDQIAASLCAKVKACGLTPRERTLFNTILAISKDVTKAKLTTGNQPHDEFDVCFEPGDAGEIYEYAMYRSVGRTHGIETPHPPSP